MPGYIVYGARGSGSTAVEAALTLAGAPYEVVELAPFDSASDAAALAPINPMRQVPALVLPSGELMTESAAILIHLAERHPDAGLAPDAASPLRPRFLRWMNFISAQIYALYWVRDDPSRLAADKAHEAVLLERTAARIRQSWATMDAGIEPAGRFLLGDGISMLDLYLTVVSRWGPRRAAFYAAAPRLAPIVRAVDVEPRLASFWAERFPFDDGREVEALPG
ncbi:glutathione S-transferase family protein [Phenylobacterium sp. LjRoot225]|uniref:glutathione S-transferase family protein n=1 Tax=Phenylobacterium sp. LjRoot225 TaxID=3342285 RepID=UPI003ECEFA41